MSAAGSFRYIVCLYVVWVDYGKLVANHFRESDDVHSAIDRVLLHGTGNNLLCPNARDTIGSIPILGDPFFDGVQYFRRRVSGRVIEFDRFRFVVDDSQEPMSAFDERDQNYCVLVKTARFCTKRFRALWFFFATLFAEENRIEQVRAYSNHIFQGGFS